MPFPLSVWLTGDKREGGRWVSPLRRPQKSRRRRGGRGAAIVVGSGGGAQNLSREGSIYVSGTGNASDVSAYERKGAKKHLPHRTSKTSPPHSFCARVEAAASLEGEVSFLCLVLVTVVLFGRGAQTSKKEDPKPDLWPQPPPAKRLSLPFSSSFFGSGFVHR